MKKIQPFLFAAMLFIYLPVYAQVGIGTATPNASAKLDITSTIRLGSCLQEPWRRRSLSLKFYYFCLKL